MIGGFRDITRLDNNLYALRNYCAEMYTNFLVYKSGKFKEDRDEAAAREAVVRYLRGRCAEIARLIEGLELPEDETV